jgi:hypothetical protein
MPAKKKPAKRVNWKARALHCEEVIGVQNQLARAAEQKLADTSESLRIQRSRATFYETQCAAVAKSRDAAENQVATLLAAQRREIATSAVAPEGAIYTEYSMLPEGKGPKHSEISVQYPRPSPWQRIKRWWR